MPVISGERVDLAVGQHVQGVAEFQWCVTEYEAQIDLLADRQRRSQLVLAHAHADHDDAGAQRRSADDAVDHAGYAHALEDHRPFRARSAEGVGRAVDMRPPR